jgi:hypothetical protein
MTPSVVKHLKSSAEDIGRLMEHALKVEFVYETLFSFDGHEAADQVRRILEQRRFDVVGVKNDGLVSGFAHRDRLNVGRLADHAISFRDEVIPASASLKDLLPYLKEKPFVFVAQHGHVNGIITRGDLRKAPMQMWLFGVISLIEMQLLRIIRAKYPMEKWKVFFSEKEQATGLRKPAQCLSRAKEEFNKLENKNEENDVAECLNLAGKAHIVSKSHKLREGIGFDSEDDCFNFLGGDLGKLRNKLAHAQDVWGGNWREKIERIEKAEKLLEELERL